MITCPPCPVEQPTVAQPANTTVPQSIARTEVPRGRQNVGPLVGSGPVVPRHPEPPNAWIGRRRSNGRSAIDWIQAGPTRQFRRAQSERITEVDRIPIGKPVQVEPARQPNGIFLGKPPLLRIISTDFDGSPSRSAPACPRARTRASRCFPACRPEDHRRSGSRPN